MCMFLRLGGGGLRLPFWEDRLGEMVIWCDGMG
jgi:hypothetical protein